MEGLVDLEDEAVPPVLRRRDQHGKSDVGAADARARLDEFVDRRRHAREEHRVKVLDVHPVRHRRRGHDHPQHILHVLDRGIQLPFGLAHDRFDRPGFHAAADEVRTDAVYDRRRPEIAVLAVRDAGQRGQYLVAAFLVRDVGESDAMQIDHGGPGHRNAPAASNPRQCGPMPAGERPRAEMRGEKTDCGRLPGGVSGAEVAQQYRDDGREGTQDHDGCRRVGAAVGEEADVDPRPRRVGLDRPRLGRGARQYVVALSGAPLETARIGVERSIEPSALPGKLPHALLVEDADLALGIGDRGGGAHDLRKPDVLAAVGHDRHPVTVKMGRSERNHWYSVVSNRPANVPRLSSRRWASSWMMSEGTGSTNTSTPPEKDGAIVRRPSIAFDTFRS